MPTPDFLGARGSNAGDDFHELWVLRHALELLDPETTLTAVSAEGLIGEEATGLPKDTWQGVDCAFYYGGRTAASSERIVVDQVKYSSSDPENNWTVSRLTKTTNETKDNSVIGRLAKAFAGLREANAEAVSGGGVQIRLISNQRISAAVTAALRTNEKPKTKRVAQDREKLVEASGLDADTFREFVRVLDLSLCGADSRFSQEEKIRSTISEWTEDDARGYINDLLGYVRRHMMMPEAKGEFITKESILIHIGFADPRGLFPCPSRIEKIEKPVPRRETTQALFEALRSPDRRKVVFHGEGGCGKTTALQELETLLPPDSTVVFFDCYGGGTYLDAEAYRHAPADAFLQLSNDLARLLRTPLFVRKSDDTNLARVFHKRLLKASEIVSAKNPDALLVVVIDAADNSVTAARTRVPPERSFVHELARIGNIPENVRFLISARSGRLKELNLPAEFVSVMIGPFLRDETALHVRTKFPDAPDQWIDDFHHYSSGVPRVQRYAFGDDFTTRAEALDYLLPGGKLLPEVFEEQLARARKLAGVDREIDELCAAVVTLPRPIPTKHLAAVIDLPEAHVRDICGDLRPGIRLDDELVSLGDEDFEAFLRKRAEANLPNIRAGIANYLLANHENDSYAASHVASALYDAGLYREILNLINSNQVSAITDPVLRSETQLQRFKIAMKVCRKTGNSAEAIMTLIRGAEALKADTTILNTLIANPDLAAQFARDRSNRIILRDPEHAGDHGRLLFQRVAIDARQGNGIAVREGFRQLDAWIKRRSEILEKRKIEYNPNFDGWEIDAEDVAAEAEAALRLDGPRQALASLTRWRPRALAITVAGILAANLLNRGDHELLSELAATARELSPWDLFLHTPLAVAGFSFDVEALERSINKLARPRLIRIASIEKVFRGENPAADFHDVIITACEVLTARGVRSKSVKKALELLSDPAVRQRNRLNISYEQRIEICLRAHVLLERLEGRTPTVQSFLLDPLPETTEHAERSTYKRVEKSEQESFVEPFLPLYDFRARLMTEGLDKMEDVETALQSAVSATWKVDYQLRHESSQQALRFRSALALARLTLVPSLDPAVALDAALRVNGGGSSPWDAKKVEIFEEFAKFPALHAGILDEISKMVSAIKQARMPASEKISGLVELSRALVPISDSDAEVVFSDAIVVAEDVDEDAIHELELFDPLTARTVFTIDNRRRSTAVSLAKIVSDTSVRLDGIERFPWDRSMRALTVLDPGVALAASCRWEDDNIGGLGTTLEPILIEVLKSRILTPVRATAFLSFLQEPSEELITRILESAKGSNASEISQLIDEIAKDELFHYLFGKRKVICDLLTSSAIATRAPTGKWFAALKEAISFVSAVKEERSKIEENPTKDRRGTETSIDADPAAVDYADKRESFLRDAIDWNGYRFVEPAEIEEVFEKLQSLAKSEEIFISVDSLLEAIAARVPLADRVRYLDALRRLELGGDNEEHIGTQINRRLTDWRGSPAVVQWGLTNRLPLLVDRLPAFTRYLRYGDSKTIEGIFKQDGADENSISTSLIEATEKHVDAFDAPTIYSLVGLIIKYSDPRDAAAVLDWYIRRLLGRIPSEDVEEWDPDDIPDDLNRSLSRFVYAQMSDIDVRKRWRGAHALRKLVRLGDKEMLGENFALFGRKVEKCFRRPQATFYWLASRMWLMIASDRIASENPEAMVPHVEKLVAIAADKSFPHLLIRAFAKSAATKLIDAGLINPSDEIRDLLASADNPALPRRVRKDRYGDTFEKYRSPGFETRFRFDEMDTLPYWYSGAIRTFARLDKQTFLETADKWIVDEWGINSEPWIWRADERNNRLEAMSHTLYGGGHGTIPVVQRLSTYLEWHAMWCTVGELMEKFPLASPDKDGYDPFAELTKAEGLSQPPYWLSDTHEVKPLSERYWFEPSGKIDDWLESINDDDFLTDLFPFASKDQAVIACSISTRSSRFRETISIESALVEPAAASALLRALQSVESPYDYRLPLVGEDFELRREPYTLLAWLGHGDRSHGLDERDQFRSELMPVQIEPSGEIVRKLDLKLTDSPRPVWVDRGGAVAFAYDSWSDSRWDDNRDRPYHSGVFSDGWRLSVASATLANILAMRKMDLIVEVRIQRRNRDYEYSGHSKEEAKETDFDRIVLFRSDGAIEIAEGCAGTWKSSSS